MTISDQNFDDRKSTFKNNIYGTSKGVIREAVLMRDLRALIGQKSNLRILDIGGGQGQVALQLAKQGHDVTLTDISDEMLSLAMKAAEEQGICNVTFGKHSVHDLPEQLNKQFDLVLCHAVFEWLEKPEQAFKVLQDMCKDDGAISFMFYNKAGQILSNLVYGNFDYIKAGMKAKKVVKLNPQSSLHFDEVKEWLVRDNLEILIQSGVRCFHDYMRDIDKWQSDLPNILAMELEYSQQAPFNQISRYIHLVLKKNNN